MTTLLGATVQTPPERNVPPPWSKRTTWIVRAIGASAVVSIAATVWLGLWITPPDKVQGNLVRLVYIHPPVAWVALYLSFGTAFVASLLWLWKRTRSPFWDRLAGAAMEVSVVFTALTLVTGSIWGRPTWGVWWAWDARLTSTAMLLVMELGYLAIRRVPGGLDARARRCAVAALITAVDVPIVHFSVVWWHTLHQGATVLNANLSPTIHGAMAWTLLLGFVAFTLAFVWMLAVRMRIETLTDALEGASLDLALGERWAEADGQPIVGQPPVSQPSVSQPSVSQPSVSQPSVSQPSVSQPPVTQLPVGQLAGTSAEPLQ